ncbi:hypothetical protein L207DRAFT_519908 [Hyaloscypha variabilis F]|jgi:hypothetical protein|uniref:Uncharacterized protein n=1 Tax=Hyaloscypha variabilis (strain UAMH 11265 / GT02V1 / F) TaxID=1149755 RepID=A0A2J6QX00_HYAVF|nr:hypothetical protein L207DRAFT_519908 [Hyaloscypha variabilis F]
MGMPFSREVQKASQHVENIAPYAVSALSAITWASIVLSFLIGALLLAVIALLITVNPDLEQERKLLVTPLLRVCLKVPRVLLGITAAETTTGREREQPERVPTKDVDRSTIIGNDAVRSQNPRRASPRYE